MLEAYYEKLERAHSVDDCVATWKQYRVAIQHESAQERAEAWGAAVALVQEMSGLDEEHAKNWLREATKAT